MRMNLVEAKIRIQERVEKLERELRVLRKTLSWLEEMEAIKE